MKTIPMAIRVIATKEKSGGNDTVGDMWIETKTFDPETPVQEIMLWGADATGKLSLTFDENCTSN